MIARSYYCSTATACAFIETSSVALQAPRRKSES